FLEIEDESDHRQGVRIDVSLFDRTTKENVNLSKKFKRKYDVTNEVNVGHLLGVPVKYPDGGTKKERIKALKEAVDRFTPPNEPKAFIKGNEVLAGTDSPFAVQIEVAVADPEK